MDYDSIGLHIRQQRIAKKMRQENIAERSGLSTNYIGMIERGEKVPSLESFIAILNALVVSSDLILCDVLHSGFQAKASALSEKISSLSAEDKRKLFAIIEIFTSSI